MKKDLWKELAARARQQSRPAAEPSFGFDTRVITQLQQSPRAAANPLAAWLSMLKPAVGFAMVVTTLSLLLNYQKQAVVTAPDFVAETETMIQLAVLNE